MSQTRGFTAAQVTPVCPQDGVAPCTGAVNQTDFTGWVWATAPQVLELFGYFAPDILTSPTGSVGGFEYAPAAAQFFTVFTPTNAFRGCPTYQPCFNFRDAAGITATVGTDGARVAGVVSQDLEFGAAGFSIGAGTLANSMGVWLWRRTGQDDSGIYAYDDIAQTLTPATATVVNVLANDWNAGQRPTPQTVSVTALSTLAPGFSLSPAGAVDVAAGTPIGLYNFQYRICQAAAPETCDSANVAVTVKSFAISAVNDQGYVSFTVGGTPVPDVLANDKLGTLRPNTSMVELTQVAASHAGIALNRTTGAVSVAQGTPTAIHTLTYSICEKANPANCAQATATLRPFAIDAVNDSWRLSSKVGAVSPSVLANDWFNGARATTAMVRVALVGGLPRGVTFSPTTGAFTVAPKTSSGTYSVTYRICEAASPDNCDSAVATLNLSGKN